MENNNVQHFKRVLSRNLTPSENLNPEHPLYKEKCKSANDTEDILLSKLSDEEKEQYKDVMNDRALSYSEEVVMAFTDGFILGFLFCEEIRERSKRYAENEILSI